MKFFGSFAMMISTTLLSSLAVAEGPAVTAPDEATAAITQEIETLGAALGTPHETSENTEVAEGSNPASAMRRGPCKRITLDDTQKAALRTALYEHKKERISIRAEVKTTHLTYAHTVSSSTSTRAEAEAAGAALTAAVGKGATSKMEFANKVLYDILTAEQRPAGYKCMKWLARHHRHHRH
jgi:hypothetical protein